MIAGVRSRLAIVAILLVLQTFIFILELLIFISRISANRWYTRLRQWFAPIGFALLSTVLVSVTFVHSNATVERTGSQCTKDVDADIAGLGVRIAAFAQVGTLILVSLLGSFHPKATGAKEVGAGLVLTTVSLAIALMVRIEKGILRPADAAIGAMILDGQSMALSLQLASKETLTSRWQVGVVVATQVIGLGTVSATISKFSNRDFLKPDCNCLTVFWWAWLGHCQSSVSSLEPAVFWTYIACRFIGIIQVSFHSLWNMVPFDRAQKDSRDTGDKLKMLGGTLIDITFPHFTHRGSARYGEYPATVTFMYSFYGLLALTSLVTAWSNISDLNLAPSSDIVSTGQIIALVIAGATILRALWLFIFLFWHERSERRGLTWPFKLRQSDFYSTPRFLTAPFDMHLPEFLPLGSLLRDPFPSRLDTKYNCHIPVEEELYERTPIPYWTDIASIDGKEKMETGVSGMNFYSRKVETTEMVTIGFKPETDCEAYLKPYIEEREIQDDIGTGTKYVTVYLVVSVRIASGLRETTLQRNGISINAGGVSVGFGQGKEQVRTATKKHTLYDYSVREITLTSDGRVFGAKLGQM